MSDSWQPPGCTLPGSSVHGFLQARTLDWVAIRFSRAPSWPGDWTCVSCTAGGFFTISCCHHSVAQMCPTLCNPVDCSTPGFPVLPHLPELIQTHVHRVGDAIWPSHPLSSPPPPPFPRSLFEHWGLFQWVSSSHQEAKVLELQLQHQSIQWIFRADFL